MLELQKLFKSYPQKASADTHESKQVSIIDDLSLQVTQGQSLSIQGPSGCGKSTLLHLIAALDTPDSGSINLQLGQQSMPVHQFNEGEANDYRRQHIGIVFQKFNLIDCISVSENILLPSKLNGLQKSPLTRLSQSLGIEHLLKKLPSELSGGEQQRVAIARALLHRPKLILADEPTGNLDEANSDLVSDLLFNTCKEYGATLLVVTHSERVAQMADIRLIMHNKRLENADV